MDATLGEARLQTGGWLLMTVTTNEPVDELPRASAAEQVTVVVPALKCVPDAGAHDTGTAPLMLSLAVAENVTVAPAPGAITVKFAGSDSAGGTPSRTVTVNVL